MLGKSSLQLPSDTYRYDVPGDRHGIQNSSTVIIKNCTSERNNCDDSVELFAVVRLDKAANFTMYMYNGDTM